MKKIQNSKKAISPVIATILLIGVAIGSGALAYSWYTGVQKGTQEASGGVSGRVAQATGAAIAIQNPVQTSKGTSGEGGVSFVLKNIGSSSFTLANNTGGDVSVYLDSNAASAISFLTGGTVLNPGSSATVNATITGDVNAGKTYILKVTTAQGGLATWTVIT